MAQDDFNFQQDQNTPYYDPGMQTFRKKGEIKLTNLDPGTSAQLSGLTQGMERGEMQAEKAYGKIEDLGKRNQEQMARLGDFSKGYSGTEMGALRDQARQAASTAQSRGNIQAGAQNIKGVAAQKQSRDVANQMGDFERNLTLDNASMIRSGTKDYMGALQEGISKINQRSIAEGGLYSNIIAGRNIANIQPPQSSGTVICTELFDQHYMTPELFIKDQDFGYDLKIKDPSAYFGYRMWADKVVWLMKRSSIFTWIVSLIALPWANHIAGNKNFIGAFVMKIGLPLCRGIYGLRNEKSYCKKETAI